MKIWFFSIGILLCGNIANATNMNEAFDEGRNIGKKNNGNAQQVIKDFQPAQIDGFNARPKESQFYTGIRGNDPNLMYRGMNALNRSESGKAIKDSIINNPKVNISQDSDFIKNSEKIRENAAAISGISGQKCVNKVLNKTTFSYHFCEKEQDIAFICEKTARVTWEGDVNIERREYLINKNDIKNRLANSLDIVSPYDGKIIEFEVGFNRHMSILSTFNKYIVSFLGMNFFKDRHISMWHADNLNFKVKKGDLFTFSMRDERNRTRYAIYRVEYIKIIYEIKKDSLRPEIEWDIYCSGNENKTNIAMAEEICTQPGGERIFEREGKFFTLNSDCWQYQQRFVESEASDNECKVYESNPNCTVGERECILQENGNCARHRVKYQCQTTRQTSGYVCGDKFFCSDGSCSQLEESTNTDFGHAVSQLATLAQAGKDIGIDPQNMKAFSGKPMFCRKSGFGFSDCCKDSGWGHKAGLAKCNSEENALGKAKEKNLVVYVGTFCSKKVLRKCISRKSSYCVFDNKLARIIQYQGRSGQLGIGFGGSKNPDCRGLSVQELQRLDFNAMDYSDFYQELNERTNIPDKQQLMDHMRNSIIEQLQDAK